MANVNVDIDSKLKLLADIMGDIATHSPAMLQNFLKDYRHIFNSGENDDSGNLSSKSADAFSQTDNIIETSPWNEANITEDVTCIAKKVTLETGLSYDENSGWYYDHKMNCYYNANYRLYYYSEHNAYYYYDEESKGLKFYCTVSSLTPSPNVTEGNQNSVATNETESLNEEQIANNAQPSAFKENTEQNKPDEEKEEGECSTSDEEVPTNSVPKPVVIEAGPTVFEPDNTKHFAPCIRVIVKSSTLPSLCSGTLFIVTCTGGTIGREGNHDVLIPDYLVSKMHSKFQYVHKDGVYFYELIDLGSKNGTYVNGKRLSAAMVKSEPTTITHGSIITVGRTDLLCHIHPYDETCSDCAPISNCGQENNGLENYVSLREKHNLEAALIRKKFGIGNYLIAKYPEGYEDRADMRRKYVGSSHDSEKTVTASINEPICKKNKGYTLLTKMGWNEGETLGKRTEGAALEPIIPAERVHKKSGLGSDLSYYDIEESKKNYISMKTLERFKQLSHVKKGKKVVASVKIATPCPHHR